MNNIIIDDTINLLNEALETDPAAIQRLIDFRTPCNDKLADHPTVQVAISKDGTTKYCVGLLGIINGILGKDEHGYGYVAALYDDKGFIKKFERFDK